MAKGQKSSSFLAEKCDYFCDHVFMVVLKWCNLVLDLPQINLLIYKIKTTDVN